MESLGGANHMEEQKTVKCLECQIELNSTREPYKYRACDLDNVVLENIEICRCPGCGEEEIVIPRIAELHRLLASTFAKMPEKLNPQQICFLRKYLGWSGVDFAAAIGVDPTTVSRWENGAQGMGVSAERLLRLCALSMKPVEDYSILKTLASKKEGASRLVLKITDHWEVAA